MMPFDISYTTFYWLAIVSIAPCCTISTYLTLNDRDVEICVRGHSMSFKLVPFKSLDALSYSPSITTMALSSIISKKERYYIG